MLTGCARESRTRRPVAQRLMRPLPVVEREPSADAPARLDHRAIRLDENLFVFQASPKPLDEDVVQETPFAIHADPDARCLKLIQKRGAGELYTLIGVHNNGILPTTRALKSPFTIRITPTRANAPR